MSLEPFHTLEEEHGQLDGDSKAANDVSVQSKFTAFFSVVIGVHSVMFVFALVFIFSEDGDAPQFAECVSTGSLFREFYPEVPTAGVNLTLPTANGHLGGNYTCVAQFSDSRMFISAISFGIASLTAGLLCHRCLPVQHPAIPYIDAVVIVAVYLGHVNAIFLTGFDHYLGRYYLMPTLQGARVSVCWRRD